VYRATRQPFIAPGGPGGALLQPVLGIDGDQQPATCGARVASNPCHLHVAFERCVGGGADRRRLGDAAAE